MDTKRLFIGIGISDSARAACSRHTDGLRDRFADVRVGWERPEQLHITLKFLGATEAALLPQLFADLEVAAARFDRFYLHLGRPGVFPSRSRPRILWIGINDPTGSTAGLQKAVEETCARFGFDPENRAFRPHLPVGRVREPDRAAALSEAHLQAQIEPVEFEVRDLIIYESKLQKTGSVYEVRSRIPLGSA